MGFATAFGTRFFRGLSDTIDKQQASKMKREEAKELAGFQHEKAMEVARVRAAATVRAAQIAAGAAGKKNTEYDVVRGVAYPQRIQNAIKSYGGTDPYNKHLHAISTMLRHNPNMPKDLAEKYANYITNDLKFFYAEKHGEKEGKWRLPVGNYQDTILANAHMKRIIFDKIKERSPALLAAIQKIPLQAKFDKSDPTAIMLHYANADGSRVFDVIKEHYGDSPEQVAKYLKQFSSIYKDKYKAYLGSNFDISERERLKTVEKTKQQNVIIRSNATMKKAVLLHNMIHKKQGYGAVPNSDVFRLLRFGFVELSTLKNIIGGFSKGKKASEDDILALKSQIYSRYKPDEKDTSGLDRIFKQINITSKEEAIGIALAYEIATAWNGGGRISDRDFEMAYRTIFGATQDITTFNLEHLIEETIVRRQQADAQINMTVPLANAYIGWLDSNPGMIKKRMQELTSNVITSANEEFKGLGIDKAADRIKRQNKVKNMTALGKS